MAKIALPCLLAASALAASTHTGTSHIDHVIVLMMENRSFDHLLGHLALINPKIDGCANFQTCTNPVDPTNPSSPTVPINNDAVDGGPDDPCHAFDCMTQQIFGFKKAMNDTTSPVTMNGFVANAIAVGGNVPFVMSTFNETNVPVLSALALEYAVFDHWHASVPTCTNPNREFMMSGTSSGYTVNDFPKDGFTQETHFKFLERHNVTWGIYYDDDPWMVPAFADLRTNASLAHVKEMPSFYTDLSSGTLPQFSLIQPRMAASAEGPSNWQHPDGSVEQGEVLMASIYAAFKASQYWENTLWIITYDESGGFYDHQPPPSVGVPAPDDIPGDNGFDFSRLGIRIPTVMVSPWIPKGTVVAAPTGVRAPTPTSQFESTSIIASANRIFGIADNMTRRDAWAGTFHDLVQASPAAVLRTDCPDVLPPVRQLTADEIAAEQSRLLNDHHLDSLNVLCGLVARSTHPVCAGFAAAVGPARSTEQEALRVQLTADRFVSGAWAQEAQYPNLHAPVARVMQQQHFGAASKALFAAFRAAQAASSMTSATA